MPESIASFVKKLSVSRTSNIPQAEKNMATTPHFNKEIEVEEGITERSRVFNNLATFFFYNGINGQKSDSVFIKLRKFDKYRETFQLLWC